MSHILWCHQFRTAFLHHLQPYKDQIEYNLQFNPSFSRNCLHRSHMSHILWYHQLQKFSFLHQTTCKDRTVYSFKSHSSFTCNYLHKSRMTHTLYHHLQMVSHHHLQVNMDQTRNILHSHLYQIGSSHHTMDSLGIYLLLS